MSVIVTDAGFGPDTFTGPLLDWDVATASGHTPPQGFGLDVPNTVSADQLRPFFDAALIRISFPSFADGRGFTIARTLRLLGYTGELRAAGHVLADQYAMARRCGFDTVEISDDLAARQPWEQWQARSNWKAHDYQAKLRGAA